MTTLRFRLSREQRLRNCAGYREYRITGPEGVYVYAPTARGDNKPWVGPGGVRCGWAGLPPALLGAAYALQREYRNDRLAINGRKR